MQLATFTCPKCRSAEKIEIPEDKCLMFHICTVCGKVASPKECCIICSYTNKKCGRD